MNENDDNTDNDAVKRTTATETTTQQQQPPSSKNAPKKNKEKPTNLVIPPKKAPMSKAERRALQEAQRAAKAGTGGGSGGSSGKSPQQQGGTKGKPPAAGAAAASQQQQALPKSAPIDTASKSSGSAPSSASALQQQQQQQQQPTQKTTSNSGMNSQDHSNNKIMMLFSHLPSYRDAQVLEDNLSRGNFLHTLHPAVIQLGRDYASGAIRGGNARCRAMLQCFAQVLSDYQPPSLSQSSLQQQQQNNASSATTTTTTIDLRQQLEQDVLKPSFDFWTNHCRPHSVSMGNAFTFFKTAVATLDRDWSWNAMRDFLLQDTIPAYLTQRLEYSDTAIAQYAVSKLQANHEVILTYGYSEVIQEVLETAWQQGKQFRVIIVDSRPLLEGRRMLQHLCSHHTGLEHACTYLLLHSLTYIMPTVTKVLLGASALMSNGSVLGRVGSAGVALAAKAHQVPVLVCCESYKISNRVQLESITHNELGHAHQLLEEEEKDDETSKALQALNLMYDLTHAELVSGVITEFGIVPPTSVAVLLREMNPHNG